MTVIRCFVGLAIVLFLCNPVSAQFYGYGQSTGTISTPTSPGDVVSEPFVFTIDPWVDEREVTVTCFVTRYGGVVGDREVLNVRQAPLGENRELPLFASSFNSGNADDWSSVSP